MGLSSEGIRRVGKNELASWGDRKTLQRVWDFGNLVE